jgi:hypothetical protein
MRFPMTHHLSLEELKRVLSTLPADSSIAVDRLRSHNRSEIRRCEVIGVGELTALLLNAYDDGHLPGGDLEARIPSLGLKLVAHHDGVFWLAPDSSV